MGWLKTIAGRLREAVHEGAFELTHSGNAAPYAWPARAAEPAARVHRLWGLKTAWVGQSELIWRKCPSCTGGAQTLTDDGWGKIPYSWRREQDDRTSSALANIRRCTSCHGIGIRWVPVDAAPRAS